MHGFGAGWRSRHCQRLGSPAQCIPRLTEYPKSPLAKRREPDSTDRMIRRGFLDRESRQDLIELARDGSAAHRLARRANALVLLDDGMSCEAIARVLLIDDDTIRTWFRLYQEDGIEGLASFGYEGGACRLTGERQDKLKAWISETLPRTTREIGAWIERECGIAYQGRSGLIRDLKTHGTGRKLIISPAQLRQVIIAHMRQLQMLPALVRSSFHAPATRYARA